MRKGDALKIVVVSDLHVNSSVALWPPDFVDDDGMPRPQSKTQTWLWRNWLDFISKIEGDYIVVVNGDPVHGIHADKDTQVVTTNRASMLRAAGLVLEPLTIRALGIYFTKGTMYHDGPSGCDAESLAQALEAMADPDTLQSSRWYLRMNLDGKLFTFAHHTPFARVYPETPPARRWKEAKEDFADFGTEIPDAIVRSHVHRGQVFPDRTGQRYFFTTPGWQLRYGYAYKVDPEGTICVGGLILWVEGGQIKWDLIQYPVPQPSIVSISTTCSSNGNKPETPTASPAKNLQSTMDEASHGRGSRFGNWFRRVGFTARDGD